MATHELASSFADAHIRPLWEIPPPGRHAPPPAHVWRWEVLEPFTRAALELTSPEVVERRALNLISPAARGAEFFTAPNLNAALQILKPGESARPHRHSMHALRFVLQGSGATTTVNGDVCTMAEGDLLLTPGWMWHEHEHSGAAPIVWLDVLDVPLHLYFGTDRFEPGPPHGEVPSPPQLLYPLADARAALQQTPVAADGLRRMRYVNPLTDGPVMTSLDCYLVKIEPGTKSRPFRTTANSICTVVAGSGRTMVDDVPLDWSARDVLSLPHGHWITHEAHHEPAYLFVVTDRDVLRRLEMLSEEFGTA
jgi:gentisate 1,2-dioxygenase